MTSMRRSSMRWTCWTCRWWPASRHSLAAARSSGPPRLRSTREWAQAARGSPTESKVRRHRHVRANSGRGSRSRRRRRIRRWCKGWSLKLGSRTGRIGRWRVLRWLVVDVAKFIPWWRLCVATLWRRVLLLLLVGGWVLRLLLLRTVAEAIALLHALCGKTYMNKASQNTWAGIFFNICAIIFFVSLCSAYRLPMRPQPQWEPMRR